jgi:hypothetical protein
MQGTHSQDVTEGRPQVDRDERSELIKRLTRLKDEELTILRRLPELSLTHLVDG